MGYTTPMHMEAWVEDTVVEDIRGVRFRGATGLPVMSGQTQGWASAGGGFPMDGAALPARVYVRWQSLVEPQTYRITLSIPEPARRLMLQKAQDVHYPDQWEYRRELVIGLAPGGKVVLWIDGPGVPAVEVLRAQAEVEPLGPYSGQSGGKYRPLSERAKQYIQQNGIPYGSW